ncbi:MAG: phage tail length tape measure family protein [Proteobacteria bacterium]|nr:phage tail length tape measure family protein [Pseudomonadota bacterium]
MSNSATIKIALKIDDQGGVRVLQNVGKESSSTGQKGKKAFNDMDRSAKSFNDSAKMSMNTMLKMGAGVAGILGLAKAWDMLKDSAKQYLELASVQEAAENKLEAVLKATGNAAGYNLEQLKAMASGLQDVTTVGDETTLAGMAILATFKEIKGEAFEGATKAAMDMSQVMDQDLKSSMVQIGKALNDPIQGLSALSRVGVSFTDDQKNMIKTLQESGDMMGAQKVILAELKSEFGGAAEAASKTFAGGLDQAKNALGDTKEEMGFVITKNQFFIELTHMATEEFKRWGEETQKNRGYLMDLAKDGVLMVVSSLKAGIETMRFFHNAWSGIKLVGQLAVQGLAMSLDALYPIIRSLLAPLDALYQGMVNLGVMDVNPFDAIGNGLATFKDSSAQVTKDVLADINKTNQKYDTVSNTLQGYIDKIKKIPVAVSEAANSEKAAHGQRMGQIDAQLKAVTELSEKELKALQEANQKKYAMDIALANQVQEDTWLIREKGLKKAIELHEDTQIKITQMEYDAEIKRNEKIEKAYEDSLKEQIRAHEQFVENVQDETADVFYDLFSSPATFWKNALDEMTDYFYRLLAQWAAKAIAEPIIVPFIQQVGGGITSALGFGNSGTTSGGLGFGNILSAGQSLWGAYSGSTSQATYNVLTSLGMAEAVPISTGALAAGAELGWGAAANASIGVGTGTSLAGGIAAAAPYLALAVGAALLISKLTEWEPTPAIGIQGGQWDQEYAPQGSYNSKKFNYKIFGQDIGGETPLAFRDYFDQRFSLVDDELNGALAETFKKYDAGAKNRGWIYTEGMDAEQMLEAVSNNVFEGILEGLKAESLGAGYEGFGLDFFKSIKGENDDLFQAFVNFNNVVENTPNFLEKITRQIEEFGETSLSAFENLSTISGIMAVIDTGLESLSKTAYSTAMETLKENWDSLTETLKESHAITEELTKAKKAENIAIGTQLTGLTANSLQSAIANGGDISGVMGSTIANALAGSVAESITQKYIIPLNEKVGKAYVDSAGDLSAVIRVLNGIDLSGAQAEIDAFKTSVGSLSTGLSQASSNLQTALSAEISVKQAELKILQGNMDTARSNYLASLDAEISKQEKARDAADQAADKFRDLADALADAKLDILSDLGGLDPVQGTALSKESYETALQGVWNKDGDAMRDLPGLARAYLESGKKTLSAVDYNDLVGAVYRQMSTAQAIARAEISAQEDIVDVAQAQLDALEAERQEVAGMAVTLLSIDQAADDYHASALALEQSGLTQQIEHYQAALTELKGINTGILSLADALANYRAAGGTGAPGLGGSGGGGSPVTTAMDYLIANPDVLNYHQAHADELNMSAVDFAKYHWDTYGKAEGRKGGSFSGGGISTGPSTGYLAELHGTEAIIPLEKGNLSLILQDNGYGDRLVHEVIQFQTMADEYMFEMTSALKTIVTKLERIERQGIKIKGAA